MKEIKEFIKISKYAGERFDLVQAGGGNASVKIDNGKMIIKSSGFTLSEMDFKKGYSIINNDNLLRIFNGKDLTGISSKREREKIAAEHIKNACIESGNRPSIEVLLHSQMQKYTLHVHPISVTAITSIADWKSVLNNLLNDILLVDYKTPGVELAIELNKLLNSNSHNRNKSKDIIFLQNHGLLVSSNNFNDIQEITESVLNTVENYLEVDFNKYRQTTKVSSLLNSIDNNYDVAYLSEDEVINSFYKHDKGLFSIRPFFPDMMVYCGVVPLEIENCSDKTPIINYKKKYKELPRIILYQNRIYFIAKNVKKARDMEEVYKLHLIASSLSDPYKISCLTETEVEYLGNWEAEKYRKNL